MAANRLLDVKLKLEWAKHHADSLKIDMTQWCAAQSRHLTAWSLTQTLREQESCIVIALGQVWLPSRWMLILGDAVYNFRACLNYLAWDLIRAGADPKPKRSRQVEFPICASHEDFDRIADIHLPGIRGEHRAIIEKHQPYNVPDDVILVPSVASPPVAGRRSHPLAILKTLSNSDKHHNPQYTFPQNFGGMTFKIEAEDFVSERLEPADPFPVVFRSGAEISTAYGRITGPNPRVKMSLQGSIGIAIEPGVWLGDALDKIGTCMMEIISEIEPVF